jgi:hypothetical protein
MSKIQMVQAWVATSRNLSRAPCLAIVVGIVLQLCSGAGVAVLVTNAPKGTSFIEIAADGPNVAAPLLLSATPDASGKAAFTLNFAALEGTRVRAIALKARNTDVFLLAAAGTRVSRTGGANISLDFARQPISMTIDRIADNGDGTVAVTASFASVGEFFSQGQVVNLWASPTLPKHAATGKLFLATLVPSSLLATQPIGSGSGESSAAAFEADFRIPKTYASGYLQIGYHGLDFQQNVQIPLLVGALYPHVPIGASGVAPLLENESSEGSQAVGAPLQSQMLQGTYSVQVGSDGRLVRVLIHQ